MSSILPLWTLGPFIFESTSGRSAVYWEEHEVSKFDTFFLYYPAKGPGRGFQDGLILRWNMQI